MDGRSATHRLTGTRHIHTYHWQRPGTDSDITDRWRTMNKSVVERKSGLPISVALVDMIANGSLLKCGLCRSAGLQILPGILDGAPVGKA